MHNQTSETTILQIIQHNLAERAAYSVATQIWKPCTLYLLQPSHNMNK